jgi:hypothetical protein
MIGALCVGYRWSAVPPVVGTVKHKWCAYPSSAVPDSSTSPARNFQRSVTGRCFQVSPCQSGPGSLRHIGQRPSHSSPPWTSQGTSDDKWRHVWQGFASVQCRWFSGQLTAGVFNFPHWIKVADSGPRVLEKYLPMVFLDKEMETPC